MLTLFLCRKVSSSVIFPLIPFAFHCISRRQLVGAGVETGPGFIYISPAHRGRRRSSSAGIIRSATNRRIDEKRKVGNVCYRQYCYVIRPQRGNIHSVRIFLLSVAGEVLAEVMLIHHLEHVVDLALPESQIWVTAWTQHN